MQERIQFIQILQPLPVLFGRGFLVGLATNHSYV